MEMKRDHAMEEKERNATGSSVELPRDMGRAMEAFVGIWSESLGCLSL